MPKILSINNRQAYRTPNIIDNIHNRTLSKEEGLAHLKAMVAIYRINKCPRSTEGQWERTYMILEAETIWWWTTWDRWQFQQEMPKFKTQWRKKHNKTIKETTPRCFWMKMVTQAQLLVNKTACSEHRWWAQTRYRRQPSSTATAHSQELESSLKVSSERLSTLGKAQSSWEAKSRRTVKSSGKAWAMLRSQVTRAVNKSILRSHPGSFR